MNLPRSPRGGALLAATIALFGLSLPVLGSDSAGSSAEELHSSSTDIRSYAEILHDGVNWTLVPRGAILHLSDEHRSMLGGRPVGNLVSWSRFLELNNVWLASEEVTLRQAEGTHAIDTRRLEYLSKQARTIVAVHHGSPIAVSR